MALKNEKADLSDVVTVPKQLDTVTKTDDIKDTVTKEFIEVELPHYSRVPLFADTDIQSVFVEGRDTWSASDKTLLFKKHVGLSADKEEDTKISVVLAPYWLEDHSDKPVKDIPPAYGLTLVVTIHNDENVEDYYYPMSLTNKYAEHVEPYDFNLLKALPEIIKSDYYHFCSEHLGYRFVADLHLSMTANLLRALLHVTHNEKFKFQVTDLDSDS